MAWKCYHLTYELLSPLHIGYHKVGNLQRTRYYVPARNLWAAVTEMLTRSGFSTNDAPQGDYIKIGQWVQNHCAFTYFYLLASDQLLAPRYVNGELCYGKYPVADFERRYLGSLVSTALSPRSTSAQSGSLHEVEFLAPHDSDGQRTHLSGWVFLDEQAQSLLGGEAWQKWLGALQVGGERRYGFGRLRLAQAGWQADAQLPDGYEPQDDESRPRILVSRAKPLLAHALAESVNARGEIEPLVGRETPGPDSSAFGQALTKAQVCWVPGAVIAEETVFVVQASGLWGGPPTGR